MQETSNSKQLIAEKVKQSANILVTVSSNPSVDALTAALGLTLMLNKLDKHATAVFSGVVPPAIGFLEPGKTFENNVDSLRDFIIALDKDKADRLRYKVEDDVVRIFITPYRTKISEKDLQFSQGDFNVDLIIALGVEDQKDLDQAITAHGRILHDATVATINAGEQKSSLGSIDWHDKGASSLSEMLATIAESLKPGILDQQISTALLTGIVAATERFSNAKTSPRVMTTAAQLMAAGANQQLIATKLQTIPTPVSPRREKTGDKQPEPSQKVSADTTDNGEMHINHQPEPVEPPAPLPQEAAPEAEKIESVAEPEPELPIAPPAAQNFEDLKQAIQEETPQAELPEEPVAPGSRNINDTGAPAEEQSKPQEEEGYLSSHPSWQGREIKPPSMGGTLNATAEQALEDKMREEEEQKRNRKILTHGGSAAPAVQPQQKEQKPAPVPTPAPVEPAQPAPQPVAPTPPAPEPEAPAPEQPAAEPVNEIPVAPPPLVVSEPVAPEPAQPAPVIEAPMPAEPIMPAPQPATPAPVEEPVGPTLEELEREAANHAAQAATGAPQTLSELEAAARQHADAALSQPAPAPQSELSAMPMPQPMETPAPAQPVIDQSGLPQLPPMPDFSTLPPVPTPGAPMPGQLPQLPGQSVMPAQPTLPELPQAPQQPTTSPVAPSAPADPSQFRIPGQ